jgi:hypothetical protein
MQWPWIAGCCGSRAEREHMHKGALLDAAPKKPRKNLIEGGAVASMPPGKGQSTVETWLLL